MLSKWLEKDDKETIISAIKIVSEMEDTEVLVKPIQGVFLAESLPSNVKILNNEHHSRKIIRGRMQLFLHDQVYFLML